MNRFYFAYGSNMNRYQMARRCPDATYLGRAVLKGHRFMINRRGVATLKPHRLASTFGVLWQITPACERVLDQFEGVAQGNYEKRTVEVIGPDERPVKAVVYIDPIREIGLPRPGYLERVIKGACQAGIPARNFQRYLKEAFRYAA